MKLKNYILCMAAIGILAGCSDNEPILDNPIQPGTALLSLAIDTRDVMTKGMTKADEDATIASLSVFVYDATSGKLLADKTKEIEAGAQTEVDSILVSPVLSKVLVLANLENDMIELLKKTDLNGALAATTVLSSESMGRFTMSSELKTVRIQEYLYNMMGYTDLQVENTENAVSIYQEKETDPSIKLYRTVARVQLMSVEYDDEKDEFGTFVSLTIDSMFLGNVKSSSYIASNKDYLQVEVADAALPANGWWFGSHEFWADRPYKTPVGNQEDGQTKLEKDLLSHQFEAPLTLTKTPEKLEVTGEKGNAIDGKQFFIYENSADGAGRSAGYTTYLVLRGTYVYLDKEGKQKEMKDRYYPIPINNNKGTSTQTGVLMPNHQGIMRNNSYDIWVTVYGPGSDEPWLPSEFINLNAKVVVVNWYPKVVIEEPVE
ncbi:hypothetical protein M2480_003125 [Parabacteroides sp. PFB2-12]|uniref:fimbrial protein n=1 Tax=unclassified Parabacteroides TaxID=2649774 RepID=UPI0024749A3B|nr:MULTISPECIES: fimbrial protein [unclassified Parabacteroides]MDH6344210.1 hypothetical protein [Parabacteroides sp. PM6-13]MDH6392117.1 hypothetical protein [Parabacteroides sp. PFB2-12]